jgi:hypothetical protein
LGSVSYLGFKHFFVFEIFIKIKFLEKHFAWLALVIFVLLRARAPGIGATLHTLQKKYMLQ